MKEKTGQAGKGSKIGRKQLLFAGGMILTDVAALVLAAWRYELWWNELLASAIMLILLGGMYMYRIRDIIPKRFFWLLGLHVLELAVVIVSYEAEGMLRPVLSVPILTAVLAGREAGIFALIFYSVVSALICADPVEILLLYLITGLIGICLFAGRRKIREYLIGGIVFLAGFTAINLVLILYAYIQVQTADLLYSVFGGVLQLLPVCVILPFLSEGRIRIPGVAGLTSAVSVDFPALVELKEREPVLYKHSRLVAGLSAQAAAEIGANVLLSEAGGFYHEIGQGLGEDCEEESLKICKKYRLPAAVQNIVKEHDPDKKTPSCKESAIVMLSDTIVTIMEQNRKKNPQSADMNAMIDRAFKVRGDSGAFLLSGLSKDEIDRLREFYIRVLGRV